MHLPEHVLQQRFFQQYQRTFPHKAHAEILHFARLASGWESDIFLLTLAYQEGEIRKTTDLVLKIVQGDQSRGKATFEYSNIKLLARAGYPVPQLVQFSAKDIELGPYILMEYIRGQSLAEALQNPLMMLSALRCFNSSARYSSNCIIWTGSLLFSILLVTPNRIF